MCTLCHSKCVIGAGLAGGKEQKKQTRSCATPRLLHESSINVYSSWPVLTAFSSPVITYFLCNMAGAQNIYYWPNVINIFIYLQQSCSISDIYCTPAFNQFKWMCIFACVCVCVCLQQQWHQTQTTVRLGQVNMLLVLKHMHLPARAPIAVRTKESVRGRKWTHMQMWSGNKKELEEMVWLTYSQD